MYFGMQPCKCSLRKLCILIFKKKISEVNSDHTNNHAFEFFKEIFKQKKYEKRSSWQADRDHKVRLIKAPFRQNSLHEFAGFEHKRKETFSDQRLS